MKKYSFVIAIIMSSLIGCGGDKDSSSLNLAQVAIEKIEAYADASNHTSIPVLEDYIKAGVTGVDNNNVGKINDAVKDIGAENVDTLEEIQALVDQLTTKVDADTTIPIITLKGKTTISLTVGDTYTEFGATAIDDIDGNISAKIKVISNVNMNKKGTYEVTYNVSDLAGNKAEERKRTVIINSPPEEITNRMPIASAVRINGVAKIGATLTLSYTFNDIDGDSEGASIIAWSTPSKELQRGTSKTFTIPKGYEGDSIGAWIHPVDSKGLESNIAYEASNNMLTIESSITNPDSLYLEEVHIPKYDINNPTHVLITTSNEMWTSSVLNDPNYKHFYVAPGTYGDATKSHYDPIYKVLTTSGTEEDRRTISLYNGNDTHPASLPDDQVANVAFRLTGASYWTIDRMANLDRNTKWSLAMKLSSNNNIINKWHLRNHGYGVTLQSGSSYNTIQNSYINHATDSSRRSHDAIGLQAAIDNKGTPSVGNKFINNDIRNATDGIQLTWNYSANSNFEGTIIDSNRIWFDQDAYVDRDGKQDPNGEYTNAENLMDIKAGSTNANSPVIITNNIMWGLKTSHPVGQDNNQILSSGTAIVFHGASQNIRLDSNVVFDVQTGINIGQDKGFGNGENIKLVDNIFYNINKSNPEDFDYMLAIANLSANNLLMKNNTIIRNFTSSSGSGNAIYTKAPSIIKNNLLIDTKNTNNATASTVEDNWFYNANENFTTDSNSLFYDNATQARMSDYTFTYERFTKVPKQKILKGIITTKESPHYKKAGSNIMVK